MVLFVSVKALRSPTWICPGGGTGKESVTDLSDTSLAFSNEAATVVSVSSGTRSDGTSNADEQAGWLSDDLCAVFDEDEMSMRSSQSSSTAGTLMSRREAIAHDCKWSSASFRKP
jgi:hypothetical protein